MRTFILGVGAQKAGTTWLYKHLAQSENYVKGLAKEYHLFDALYLGQNSSMESHLIKRINNNLTENNKQLFQHNLATMKSFFQNEKNYFDYFDSLLVKANDFSADITPLYSVLTSNVLSKIRNEFKQRDIDVKVVFLMREPISRLESSIKMNLKRNKKINDITDKEMLSRIHAQINSNSDLLRSDYSHTCQQLDRSFPQEKIFYGFYETLFSGSETKRLSTFFNMQAEDFDTKKVINKTTKHFKYPLVNIKSLREKVEDRYQFVSERFNFDTSIWEAVVLNMIEKEEKNKTPFQSFTQRFLTPWSR